MLSRVGNAYVRRSPYKGSPFAILCRRLVPILALVLAVPAAGCSFSYQLGSLFGDDDKADHTGSISPKVLAKPAPAPPDVSMPESDLAFARAAAVDVVSRDGRTLSAPWENPQTGARGTVTPIAQAYASDGTTCRDFLASYVRQGSEAWLQGAACRGARGKWEVRNLRPWKRS